MCFVAPHDKPDSLVDFVLTLAILLCIVNTTQNNELRKYNYLQQEQQKMFRVWIIIMLSQTSISNFTKSSALSNHTNQHSANHTSYTLS